MRGRTQENFFFQSNQRRLSYYTPSMICVVQSKRTSLRIRVLLEVLIPYNPTTENTHQRQRGTIQSFPHIHCTPRLLHVRELRRMQKKILCISSSLNPFELLSSPPTNATEGSQMLCHLLTEIARWRSFSSRFLPFWHIGPRRGVFFRPWLFSTTSQSLTA